MVVWGATDGNICIRPVSLFYSDSHGGRGRLGDQDNVMGRENTNLLGDTLSSHGFKVINAGEWKGQTA